MAGNSEQGTVPTPKEIDELIAECAAARKKAVAEKAVAKLSSEAADVIEARLTAMVEQWGVRHTEKSKRLTGLNGNTATTTTATPTVIVPEAVDKFLIFLRAKSMARLLGHFFKRQVVYSMVAAPAEVLRGLKLSDTIRETLTPMVAMCFEVKKNAPGLKVDYTELAKKAA
jgi:hypothetical protein